MYGSILGRHWKTFTCSDTRERPRAMTLIPSLYAAEFIPTSSLWMSEPPMSKPFSRTTTDVFLFSVGILGQPVPKSTRAASGRSFQGQRAAVVLFAPVLLPSQLFSLPSAGLPGRSSFPADVQWMRAKRKIFSVGKKVRVRVRSRPEEAAHTASLRITQPAFAALCGFPRCKPGGKRAHGVENPRSVAVRKCTEHVQRDACENGIESKSVDHTP